MNSLIESIIFIYGISWVYKKFIKGKNNNEINSSINSFISFVKTEFEKTFKTKKNDKHYKVSSQQIFDEETKRKSSESYENALILYKAGVITKEELKEFKN